MKESHVGRIVNPAAFRVLFSELPPGNVAIVSGFGDDGRGGIFAIDGDGVTIIDSIETTGIACDMQTTARLLRAPGERTSTAELVVYDDRGVVSYTRIDGCGDPHDVVAVNGAWVVVSTWTNEILRVTTMDTEVIWHGEGAPDACHVNCVTLSDGELWATAFGRFETQRGWRGDTARGRGVLWSINTGETIGNLSHPHSPRCIDGRWLVCNSLEHEVVELARDGEFVRRQPLGGYTRGLTRAGGVLLAGVSALRGSGSDAAIAILDEDLTPLAHVPVPCSEIYDVTIADASAVMGIRTGFMTNTWRAVRRPDALPLFGAVANGWERLGTAVPRESIGNAVRCALPEWLRAGTATTIDVEIENTGRWWLASVDPEPVLVASRWIADGTQIDGGRVPLPNALAPGQRAIVRLPLQAPGEGEYELSVSLVQEGRFWFDDVDRRFGARRRVRVTTGRDGPCA